jgi:hypothetical protein
MRVERVLPVTGVISGSAASSKLSALKKVDGVTRKRSPPFCPLAIRRCSNKQQA